MHEKKEGKLKSGRSDKKVTNRKPAIAIGLSEAASLRVVEMVKSSRLRPPFENRFPALNIG